MISYINHTNKIIVNNKKLLVLKGSEIARKESFNNNIKNNTINVSQGTNNTVRN